MPNFSSFAMQFSKKLSGIFTKFSLWLNLISFKILVQFGRKQSGIEVISLCEKSMTLNEEIFVRKPSGIY